MRTTTNNTRSEPAAEQEFLTQELALGHLSMQRRWRVLGRFTAYSNGVPISISDLVLTQEYETITFVGLVSTLLGQQGLHSQCLWYKNNKFDWYWARIENVEWIERRTDSRFRGGVPCIWIRTSIAEYAVTSPHPEYAGDWLSVLKHFNVAPINAWPMAGHRPDWWPAQSSGEWPYQHHEDEPLCVVSPQDEIRQLAQQLSAEHISSRPTWRRLGAHVDDSFPDQPTHNLGQLPEWDLGFDGGLKVTRERLLDNPKTAPVEGRVTGNPGHNRKRKRRPRNDQPLTKLKR